MSGSSPSVVVAAGAAEAVEDQSLQSPVASYKCTTCVISFEHSKAHRDHMRSDWHVYNLKRRIASLPPVSSTVFEARVVPISGREEDDSSFRESCTYCRKVYYSKNAYENHFRSQNHTRKVGAIVDASSLSGTRDPELDTRLTALSLKDFESKIVGEHREVGQEEVKDDDDNDFISSTCLFCPTLSTSLDTNIVHMQKAHGLFIPDAEYLIDTESFLDYLSTIINDFQECLYCSITKSTSEAIQHHMQDKGHCKINFDEGSEYRLFYDYSILDSGEDTESESGAQGAGDGTGLEPSRKGTTGFTAARDTLLLSIDNEDLHLPSGKILSHRSSSTRPHHPRRQPDSTHHNRTSPLTARPDSISYTSDPNTTIPIISATPSTTTTSVAINPARTQQKHNRQLTIRKSDMLSLAGVPAHQQRALRAVQKMHLRAERRAREAYVAGVQKGGNRQKFFKPDVPGPRLG